MFFISSKVTGVSKFIVALFLVLLTTQLGHASDYSQIPNSDEWGCGGMNLGTTLNPNDQACTSYQWFNIRATGTSRAGGAKWSLMGYYNGDFDRALPLMFGIANREIMTLDTRGLNVNGNIEASGNMAIADSDGGFCDGISLGTTLNPNETTCATAQWLNIRATGTSRAAGAQWLVMGHYNGDSDRALPLTFGIANREIMTIDASGYVGIGTSSPVANLDVVGTVQASTVAITSDARLKTNIIPLTNVLDKIEKLHGVSFEWNEVYKDIGRDTGRREIGVIAQEVEAVYPELVTTWGKEGYKAVDYAKLGGVLVEAIKELQADAKTKLAIKDAQIAVLEARLSTLEQAVGKSQASLYMSSVGLFAGAPLIGGFLLAGLALWRRQKAGGAR